MAVYGYNYSTLRQFPYDVPHVVLFYLRGEMAKMVYLGLMGKMALS